MIAETLPGDAIANGQRDLTKAVFDIWSFVNQLQNWKWFGRTLAWIHEDYQEYHLNLNE